MHLGLSWKTYPNPLRGYLLENEMTAEIIQLTTLMMQETDKLTAAFYAWSGEPDEPVCGFHYEDVFWELHRRGCAPVIG